MHKKGFVYLVGAGCGSADLITVRGLRLLQSCDAVVYDDLIDPALLAQAAHAEQHPAGKRCGRHSMPQSEINSLLVRLGQSGKTVVRLKGGDPFVFGRGGEEFLALQAAGVPCEEVPGISSCIAVPAAAGIPVTHRGASRSFHVITGHTAQTGDTLPESLEALAALHGTLVFLMGLNSLEQIAARLTAAGKPPETPAAVVSGGNAPHPATVRGTRRGKPLAVSALVLNIVAFAVVLATQAMFSAAIDEATSGPSAVGASVEQPSSEPQSSEPQADYSNLAVGTTAELDNGLSVCVQSVETGLSNYDGSAITGVTVSYANNGSSEASFNLFDWKAQDSQGAQRNTAYYSEATDDLSSGSLAPGGTVTGNLYFEGDVSKILYYSSLFYDSSVAWTVA